MRFELTREIARIVGEDEKVIQEASADMVARLYFSHGDAVLNLLPPAVRWIASDCLAFIMERPPQAVNIAYKDNTYDIFLPWTVWGVRLDLMRKVKQSYLFARNYPLSTFDDPLFSLPLPNMKADSEVALPSAPGGDVAISMRKAIDKYWSRPFTGTNLEILSSEDRLPGGWAEHARQGVDAYLKFLGSLDMEQMNFTEFQPAHYATMGDLANLLEKSDTTEDKTATQILEDLVRKAAAN